MEETLSQDQKQSELPSYKETMASFIQQVTSRPPKSP
jgi:hypothetical protein